MNPFHSLALLCILVLPLTACMPGFVKESGPVHAETYYIDAPKGFAMEYPANWTKAGQSALSVSWQPPPEKDGETEVMATVTSLSPSDVPGGDDRMLKDFSSSHPGFVLTSEDRKDRPGSSPALRVLGHTPTRVFLAYFITTRQRAFVLEFSAPPQRFDSYRPIFEEMADSFRGLEKD